MTTQRKGFWRGFTWKRFWKTSLLFFVGLICFFTVYNYFSATERVSDLFTVKEMSKRILMSLAYGFIIAVWHEPGIDDQGKPLQPE